LKSELSHNQSIGHKTADRQLFDGHFARNGAYFAASDHEGFYTLYGTGPTQKYQVQRPVSASSLVAIN
jgi:hypothetical protein